MLRISSRSSACLFRSFPRDVMVKSSTRWFYRSATNFESISSEIGQVKTPEEINTLFAKLESSHTSENLEDFVQSFKTLTTIGGKTDKNKLHSLVDRYFKKEWTEKFDQTSVFLTLVGLKSIDYRTKTGVNDVLLNLSACLATVPISSTSNFLGSVSFLSKLGLNEDFLSQVYHEKIFAQIMVDCESDVFRYLPNLGRIHGLRWSHIPSEIQDKILDKLPKLSDVGLNGAVGNLVALGQLHFPVTRQTPETLKKINELAIETLVEFCKKDNSSFMYSPAVVLKHLILIGFDKNSLSPAVLSEYCNFMESDIRKDISETLSS
jgi:hypothetical protein